MSKRGSRYLRTAVMQAAEVAVYLSFSAADRQAPHVQQPKTWIFVAAQHLRDLERLSAAKTVDSGENLVVLVPDDIGVFVSYTEAEEIYVGETRLRCTDPVQTYVDLMHSGGRGEEAAQALLEQMLLPAWKGAGAA